MCVIVFRFFLTSFLHSLPFFLPYPCRQSNKPYILNFTRICALNRSDCCYLLVQGHPKGLWNRLFPCFYIKPSAPPRHRLYSMWTGITKQHYFVWRKKKSDTASNELVSRECTLLSVWRVSRKLRHFASAQYITSTTSSSSLLSPLFPHSPQCKQVCPSVYNWNLGCVTGILLRLWN